MKTSEENGSYCHGEHHTHTSSPAPGRSFFDRETRRRKNLDWKLWIYDLRTNKHFTLKKK